MPDAPDDPSDDSATRDRPDGNPDGNLKAPSTADEDRLDVTRTALDALQAMLARPPTENEEAFPDSNETPGPSS